MSSESTESQPSKIWQKKWFQNLLWIVIFLAAFLTLRPMMQGDVVQGKAPNIQAETLTGKTIDLSQIKEPVLVHFWATWCPICSTTSSFVESVAEDYPVINVATQSGDDELIRQHALDNGMNPALIINDEGGELMQAYGARAVPADFIINSKGEIEFVEVGFTSAWGLRLRLWLTD